MKKTLHKWLSMFGGLVAFSGIVLALSAWIGSVMTFYGQGRDFWGFVSLMVPPANVILAFVAHPLLGVAAISSPIFFYSGIGLFAWEPSASTTSTHE